MKIGLNIIPWMKVCNRQNFSEMTYIQPLWMTKALIFPKIALIMRRSGVDHFSQNTVDFEYKNTIEKLYYESIGKHLNLFHNSK
jgi:hypothetical protein